MKIFFGKYLSQFDSKYISFFIKDTKGMSRLDRIVHKFFLDIFIKHFTPKISALDYGKMRYQVSKRGIQNWINFLTKINTIESLPKQFLMSNMIWPFLTEQYYFTSTHFDFINLFFFLNGAHFQNFLFYRILHSFIGNLKKLAHIKNSQRKTSFCSLFSN